MNPAEKIDALEKKRDTLESQLVSGISEQKEIAIRQQIFGIDQKISAHKNMEVAVMQDPWALRNMSASIFFSAFMSALGFGAATMFQLSKEGRFFSTMGGMVVGLFWGENGRRKGGW